MGNPTPKYNQTPQYNVQPFAQPEMFVDIKVRIGEESIKFEQLPANQAVANKNKVVVSDNLKHHELALRDVHAVGKTYFHAVRY